MTLHTTRPPIDLHTAVRSLQMLSTAHTAIATMSSRPSLTAKDLTIRVQIKAELEAAARQEAIDNSSLPLLKGELKATVRTSHAPIHPPEPLIANQLDILSPLMAHKNIIDRIMREIFPGDSIYICEYAKADNVSPHHKLQDQYDVSDRGSPSWNKRSTTYFATQHPKALDIARPGARKPSNNMPSCNFTPALLRVNKLIHGLAQKYLYGKNFRFQCSALGVITFLRVHRKCVHWMTQIEVFYHFKAEPGVIETDGEQWHNMMCKIRHHFCIPSIHIHIGHHFWAVANWSKGPHAVMRQNDLRDGRIPRGQPSFLFNIAKIAAPADRWQDHSRRPYTHCSEGTKVQISIEGTMSEEEVVFVEQLNEEILRLGLARPLFCPAIRPAHIWEGYPLRRIAYTRTLRTRPLLRVSRWGDPDESDW